MRKILITGAAGLIGSHLSDALLGKGYIVIGIDDLSVGRLSNIGESLKNKNYRFVKCNILDDGRLKKAVSGAETIVHLAASKKIGESGDALKTMRINCDGTRNILEAARGRRIKVVFASTSDVYGRSGAVPFREDGDLVIGAPIAKRWAYAVSKIYGEQIALAYYKEHGVPVVILRYFGAFSPRSSFTWSGGHVPLFIEAALNGKKMVIHGDGKQKRSMAYVDDLIAGTILALECPRAVGEIFNIGNDEEASVIDTARLIQRMSGGRAAGVKFVPFKKIFGSYNEILRRVPDLSKARRILGYRPTVSLKEGIRRTIEDRLRSRNGYNG